ncbi:WG repeat-containing protein [uncultured Imperialibacter sp.]|uniref:WG repeat-containing protein n=1 Tax=uncultured Imperialibacter sp. TaxID=1672639 RepID=UPI0030D9C8C3|tara:strand:+ start:47197 stop:49443 length:2247 start_codon:yes stop_codon:yes gene_type:complete
MKLSVVRFVFSLVLALAPILSYGKKTGERVLEVFELNNRKGLKDDQGKILIPAKYEDIGWSNGGVDPLSSTIGYKSNGFWGLSSLNDQQITKAVYRDLSPMSNGFLKASRTDSFEHFLYFGVLDTKGTALVGFQYYDIISSGDNYIASRYENQKISYGLISGVEATLIPFQFKAIKDAGNGIYQAVDARDKLSVWTVGGLKLPVENLDSMFRVNSNLLIISKEGKLGAMRNDGSIILEPFYKEIVPENDSVLRLTTYPSWHLTDGKNKRLKTFSFDDIETIGPSLYRVQTYQGEAIINISGEQLSNKSNWSVVRTDENFVVSKEQNKFRVYNKSGEPFLEQYYDSLYFDGKYFYTQILKNDKELWDVYNTYGRRVTRHSYDQIKPEGSKLIMARRDAYWGFLDFNGGIVIDHKFERAHSFVEGMSAVEYVGKWGVIDINGDWVLEPKHDYCEVINEAVILIKNGESTDLVTPGRGWLHTSSHSIYANKSWLIEETESGNFGLLTSKGQKVTAPEFNEVMIPDMDSVVFLRQGDYWWSYGKDGNKISDGTSKYQGVSGLSEAFFGIVKDDKFGFVDLDNKLRIANRYDSAAFFQEGMAAIKLRGHWGFIDKIERLVVQPIYDSVTPFSNGISVVSRNGKSGIIARSGDEVVGLDFDEIKSVDKNTYILKQGNQYGFYHRKSAYVMLPRFNQLELLPNGLFVVEKRGQKGLINEKGVDVIPSVYDDIHYDLYNAFYLCKEEGKTETFLVR